VEEYPDDSKDLIQMATSSGDSAPHIRWGIRCGWCAGRLDGVPRWKRRGLFLAVHGRHDVGWFVLRWTLSWPAAFQRRPVVDFNCAYNPNWSCPIPPPENRLTVAINAGEKKFPEAEGR